jgi:hypothetical protein
MSSDLSLPASPGLRGKLPPAWSDEQKENLDANQKNHGYIEQLQRATHFVNNLFWFDHPGSEIATSIATHLLLTGSKGLQEKIQMGRNHSASEIFKGKNFRIYQSISNPRDSKPIKLSIQSIKEGEEFVILCYRKMDQKFAQIILDSRTDFKQSAENDDAEQEKQSPFCITEGAPVMSLTTGKVFALATGFFEADNSLGFIRISTVFEELKAAQDDPNDKERARVAANIIKQIEDFNKEDAGGIKVPDVFSL